MNERAKLAQIIVQAIEEFPKVHKFLTSGDTGCHPQYFVDVIADRILARLESELFDITCPGCQSKYTYPIKRYEKENGIFTQFACHNCRSIWEARTGYPSGLKENILTGFAAELKTMLDEALEENERLKAIEVAVITYLTSKNTKAALKAYDGMCLVVGFDLEKFLRGE